MRKRERNREKETKGQQETREKRGKEGGREEREPASIKDIKD